jgi:pimeloyl-ACP methyl ester carboxylesterase
MALAFLGCSVQGPIKSDPGPDGLQDAPSIQTRAAHSETPAAHPKTGQVPRIEPAECVTQELVDAGAKCFLFFGQENRDAPNGTVVELPVAVIAPEIESEPRNLDPVFYFPGGPGLSEMSGFEWVRNDSGNRTVVLVEHRGFVHAKPTLSCPGRTISPNQNALSPVTVSSTDTMERLLMHAETVERCYEKLIREGIDVTKYNEYDISRDTDEIRELLGYDEINIYGYSTGAGTAIAYLRYYPDSVRSIVLGAPWFGEYRNRPAIDEFYTLKQKYTDILGLCVAEEPRCRELIPAWYYEIDRARRVLDEQPYLKTVQTEDGETLTLSFDGVAFLGRVYTGFESVYMKLPNVLARIQRGDYSALDDFFETDQWTEVSADDSDDSVPYGYYLAHLCGDSGANRPTRQDVISMLEREPALLTFEDLKICAWWGADGAVPPSHNNRFHSDVPGLSLHGQVDSVCGIRWGYYVAQPMPNLQLVELQGLTAQ